MKMKVYYNGKIYTADKNDRFVDTVITIGNKIYKTGRFTELQKYVNNEAELIDLKGRLMIPGITDSHIHIEMGGFKLLNINLEKADSKENFRNIIREYIKKNKPGFITGGNWRNYNWPGSELPDISWIDDITGDIPALLYRMDYHLALANSSALKLAGITNTTPDPEGGKIVKNAAGNINGLLIDKAINLVANTLPKPTFDQKKEAVKETIKLLNSYGITAAHDVCYTGQFETLLKLSQENKLNCRIHARLPFEQWREIKNIGFNGNYGNDFLQTGSLKAFGDGSLGAGSAWFYEPYSDDKENYGIPGDIISSGILSREAPACDKEGFQLSIHAIGDKANGFLADLALNLNKENGKRDRRFRIEHAQHLTQNDIKKCAVAGVVISAQPYHLFDDGDWAEDKIGSERLNGSYPYKSLAEGGCVVCFGSDFPIVTPDPFAGMYAAVTRQTKLKRYENGLAPVEKLSITEAVRAYTINGAYAAFNEDLHGSIEPGKFADFAVLDRDIFNIDTDDIVNTKAEATILNGEIIYGSIK